MLLNELNTLCNVLTFNVLLPADSLVLLLVVLLVVSSGRWVLLDLLRKTFISCQSQLAREKPQPEVHGAQGRGGCWLSSQHKEMPDELQKTPCETMG